MTCGAGVIARRRWCAPGPPDRCKSVEKDICVRAACQPGISYLVYSRVIVM